MTVRPGMGKQYTYMVNKYGKIVFDDIEDEEAGYNACLDLVLSQTRWVLDNLDRMQEFKVSWLYYGSKEGCKKHGKRYGISAPRNEEVKQSFLNR